LSGRTFRQSTDATARFNQQHCQNPRVFAKHRQSRIVSLAMKTREIVSERRADTVNGATNPTTFSSELK
jgi:hypothetical protein